MIYFHGALFCSVIGSQLTHITGGAYAHPAAGGHLSLLGDLVEFVTNKGISMAVLVVCYGQYLPSQREQSPGAPW